MPEQRLLVMPKLGLTMTAYIQDAQVYVCPDDDQGQSAGLSYAVNSCTLTGDYSSSGYQNGKPRANFDNTFSISATILSLDRLPMLPAWV